MRRSRRSAHAALPIIAALLPLGSLGCENDVSVHLLPKPLVEPEPVEPEPVEPEPVEPEPVCIDGEPCSGLYWALRFQGAYDRVEIPSSPLLDVPQDFAVEAWVLVKSYEGGHGVFNRWTAGVGDIQLTFGVPEPLPQLEFMSTEQVPSHVLASWGFVRPEYWITVAAPTLPSVDAWHHLAVSYGAGSYQLYVDGVLAASVEGTERIANAPNTLYLGATARNERGYDGAQGPLYWPPIDGFIADVRISAGNRYSTDFVPEPRLSADGSTIALWSLDEGEGTQALDSGRSQLAGAIVGAQWALAPRRGVESGR